MEKMYHMGRAAGNFPWKFYRVFLFCVCNYI